MILCFGNNFLSNYIFITLSKSLCFGSRRKSPFSQLHMNKERHIQTSIRPIQKVCLIVQSKSIGPNQAGVHNRDPEVSSQGGSLDFGISAPVSPVHVPSHPKEEVMISSRNLTVLFKIVVIFNYKLPLIWGKGRNLLHC